MLETLLGTSSEIDRFLDSAKDSPSIVLYGAGFAVSDIVKKLENHGFSIAAICDSNPEKHGGRYRETYPIMSFDEAKVRFPGARFLISSPTYFDEIHAFLSQTLAPDRLCDVDLTCAYFFGKGEFAAYFASELSRFQAVYESLADEASRQTYCDVIKAHMTGDRKDFERASTGTDDWYLLQTLLKPAADTVYVDCGAYDGDTVELFLDAADAGYAKAYALEPDPAMQESLRALAARQGGKVTIVPKGVADRDGTISFVTNGVFSNIVEGEAEGQEGAISIPVARLDTLLLNEDVSIIKFDIEGGEYDALKGAAQLIRKRRPKLAICLYHKVEDFVRIAELVQELLPEYRLRLKHQSRSCTDTILFATLD